MDKTNPIKSNLACATPTHSVPTDVAEMIISEVLPDFEAAFAKVQELLNKAANEESTEGSTEEEILIINTPPPPPPPPPGAE